MTDAPHAQRQIEMGRGEKESLKGKKMSMHTHPCTQRQARQREGGEGKAGAGGEDPRRQARVVRSGTAACAGAASANQHPHTSPLDKYLLCQALYHFGLHQINLDSCNKKRPDALPAARAALTVLLPPHGPRGRSVKDRISSHQSGPDFSHAM